MGAYDSIRENGIAWHRQNVESASAMSLSAPPIVDIRRRIVYNTPNTKLQITIERIGLHMKKRIIALFLALLMATALCSCAKEEEAEWTPASGAKPITAPPADDEIVVMDKE